MTDSNIGNVINYCGEDATIIDEDKTHILIELASNTKIASAKYLHNLSENELGRLF